jgi:DNA polymerase III epsilon subunit-like protein
MLALVFDTETTGLYQNRRVPSAECQPDIVQIFGMLADDDRVYSHFNLYVHSDVPIPPEAYNSHRIDRRMTERVGVSRLRACQVFDSFARKADIIVGHNVEFDVNVMRTAFHREGGVGKSLAKPLFCTMRSATNACAIPHPNPKREGEFKWPSLTEAFTKLVDPRGFSNAHDAEADVRACYEVYRVLRKNADKHGG